MPVRSPRRRFGLDVRVMGREIVNWRALENIIANDVPRLMRATASHHRTLHGKQFHHTRQLFLYRLFATLMRERIWSFKTLLRFPGPPFFHLNRLSCRCKKTFCLVVLFWNDRKHSRRFQCNYLLYSESMNPCLSNFSTILGCMNCPGLALRASGRFDQSRMV